MHLTYSFMPYRLSCHLITRLSAFDLSCASLGAVQMAQAIEPSQKTSYALFCP
jgi:hypothetical protein